MSWCSGWTKGQVTDKKKECSSVNSFGAVCYALSTSQPALTQPFLFISKCYHKRVKNRTTDMAQRILRSMAVCVTVEEILRTGTEHCTTLHSCSAYQRTFSNPKVLYCVQNNSHSIPVLKHMTLSRLFVNTAMTVDSHVAE